MRRAAAREVVDANRKRDTCAAGGVEIFVTDVHDEPERLGRTDVDRKRFVKLCA